MQVDGLVGSIRRAAAIIEEEVSIVGRERVFLGGISQGCAIAIHALLAQDHILGGFVGLSSWLPFRTEIDEVVQQNEEAQARVARIRSLISKDGSVVSSTACLDTPVMIQHCMDDEVVPCTNGESLAKTLRNLRMQVDWREYGSGGHWLNEPQGVDDLSSFLQALMEGKKV